MPNGPLFLARGVYRRRRLRDAARLMPVLGLLLFLLPGLGHDSVGNARDAIYLFAAWGLLIVFAAILAQGLSQSDAEGGPSDRTEDET